MITVLTNKYLIFNQCTKEYIASYLTWIELTRKLLFIVGFIQFMFFSNIMGLFPMADGNSSFEAGNRVLILFPPFHDNLYGEKWKKSESPFAPLGINYLATPLVKAGYQVSIIDLQVDHLSKLQYFNSFKNTDFVLISCFTFAYNIFRKLYTILKLPMIKL